MAEDVTRSGGWWRRRNWWKIGFFVLLFAFEFAREGWVVSDREAPSIWAYKLIYSTESGIYAEGRWRRSDGGDRLVPAITSIECSRASSTCRVTEVLTYDGGIFPPETEEYAATFEGEAVGYSHQGGCTRYDVMINAETEHATAVRRLLPEGDQTAQDGCKVFEDRMEMVLTEGSGSEFGDYDFPEGQFLPIFGALALIF